MSTIKQIKAPISDEIAQFNKEFISNIKTEKGLLDKILRYIIKRKGKQIRPILVLLSAKLVGKISERTFTAATLIELLHTATLVHDDVVDNSNIRRGFFSVNALWKNKIAVLIGDFLLAKGLDISVKKKEFKILEIVSETVQQMSKGELLQIQKSRSLEISEKIPWSNGYESMIYTAWATLLSGIIFSKKSNFTLSATAIVGSLILMFASMNWMDPTITNLVPVLNSYWLMIHVAIIVASYGFLFLGAILGLMCLWIIVFTNNENKKKLKSIINSLTNINERGITVGVFMLTIGTFLGGVWANESWGRYWGWDPKETWALVSILVYAFVLHMRLIPAISSKYSFNLASLVAIWSILMTYFGVNYYLSGLHSYAAGDPMPIPNFVYYFLFITIVTAILSRIKFKKYYI